MRVSMYLLLAAPALAPRPGAQSLADRVTAVKHGTVEMTSDRDIRRKAVFSLGQSNDPRATKFLEERISQ